MKNFFISTPIYYVNGAPHVGHAYTNIVSDTIARFKTLDGFNVKFSTGTDEHGQKVAKSALQCNMSPQKFSDQMSEQFKLLADSLNLSTHSFTRTTSVQHKEVVQSLWNKLIEKNQIYLGTYSGWYSVRDEAFYSADELIDGKAPTGAAVEWVEEKTYFFRLSQWQTRLLRHYQDNPEFVRPIERYNEVLSFIKSGLRDVSISRTTNTWGIKVPNDCKHTIYVWFEALINYISVIQESKNHWPPTVHIIGKDILRFHAIFWPAILYALDYQLPKSIFAHGWWTNNGIKISKSLGNVVDPEKLIAKYSADYLRYYLLREIQLGGDGRFSDEKLIERVNSELVNKIGNLFYRTTSFIYKNCGGIIPSPDTFTESDRLILRRAYSIIKSMKKLLSEQNLKQMLEEIILLATEANIYIDTQAPWVLKRTDNVRMCTVLYILMEIIRVIAILLQPFTPNRACKILDYLQIKSRNHLALNNEHSMEPGLRIELPSIIFNRII